MMMKTAFLLISSSISLVFSQGQGMDPKPYDFPVKPGSPEWAALDGFPGRVEVCNIASEYAQTLTTKALVTTCLNYPLRGNYMFSSSTYAEGFKSLVMDRFVGFQELLQRKDAGKYLLHAYDDYSIDKALSGEFSYDNIDYRILNMLLARNEVFEDMAMLQLEQLFHKALQNSIEVRERTKGTELSTEFDSSRLAMKLLYQSKLSTHISKRPFDSKQTSQLQFKRFIEHGWNVHKEFLDRIITFARQVTSNDSKDSHLQVN